MMLWLTIACRNLFRNHRRSLFTILAIGFGFAGVTLFSGFVHYISSSLRDMQIYGRAGGHLTVLKKNWNAPGAIEEEASFTDEETALIEKVLAEDPNVVAVSPGTGLSAILSNGEASSICYGFGISPSTVERIRNTARGLLGEFRYYEGDPLSDEKSYGIGISRGLRRALDLKLGDSVVLAGPTADGQFNAVDCEVLQIFETTGDQSDRSLLVPIEHVRRLRNSYGAQQFGVLLREGVSLPDMRKQLTDRLAAEGIQVEIFTWEEMSHFYRRVRDMFNVINRFNLVIVLVIAGMSVINTIGMAVMERTREIGTLRALGLKPRGVLVLFALESALIGLCGTGLGVLLLLAGWLGMDIAKPTWIPPQINVEVPLQVHLVPEYIVLCAVGVVTLAVLAALIASRRAARMEVVDALGHS